MSQKTWGDHEVESNLDVGGTLDITGQSIFSDKIKFTQTEGEDNGKDL